MIVGRPYVVRGGYWGDNWSASARNENANSFDDLSFRTVLYIIKD